MKKNDLRLPLYYVLKHFPCQKYVVFLKTDFKTDRLELSISV